MRQVTAFLFTAMLIWSISIEVAAQNRPLRVFLNDDSTSYAGVRINGQLWARYNYNNPGTLINGEEASRFFDISVRRLRFQTYARLNDRTNVTLTLGQNNINYLTARSGEIRLLDFYIDHRLHKYLTVGGGQSGWNGVSRFASPHTGRMLTLDVPAVVMPTINQTDNILRKLSAYVNGQWEKWDYRLVFSRPYAPVANTRIGQVSSFSYVKSGVQTAAYVKYQFFEHETLVSPFHVGTYDGNRKVLALGAGFETQQKAMWHLNDAADTVLTPMNMLAVDLFGEIPLARKRAATFYAGYFYYDFGPDYIRIIGLNNVGGGTTTAGTFSGTGNAWPAIGTGHIGYFQLGYLFGSPKKKEKWQPFISGQYANYARLNEAVTFFEGGINLLLDGQRSKLSLAVQNRPVFDEISPEVFKQVIRKNTFILQYQIRLE
ncbi:MAG: hypothetical protein JJU34_08870 [Lunatimonas sp.]|uniref:hypothetical protein n=1 Tax=Lunatimonas sp. TaxID=2060141 RepID=UPI00263AC3B7|nr:hypothetical protein [Lunatimonas sp.]MCC5937380.1 hypothetical protein [Lunatimonas sp.]